MPEYIPPISEPTGIAESIANLIAQQGQVRANMYQQLGQQIGSGLQSAGNSLGSALAERFSRPTTAQDVAAGIIPSQVPTGKMIPAPGPAAPGQATPQQSQMAPAASVYGTRPNPGIQSFLERKSEATQQQNAEYQRTMLLKQMGLVPITQEMIDDTPGLKQGGVVPGYYPPQFASKFYGQKSGTGQLTSQQETAAETMAKKNWPAEALGGSFGAVRSALIGRALQINPNYDPVSASINFQANKGLAASSKKTALALASASNAVNEGFNSAADMLKKLGLDSSQPVNSVENLFKRLGNNPNATQLKALLTSIAQNQAFIYKGGNSSPTNEETNNALKSLTDGLNSEGLQGVKQAYSIETSAKIETYLQPQKSLSEAEKKESKKEPVSNASDMSDDDILKALNAD